MQYGRFDDRKREYVVERPDTPAPWINYLGEGLYGGIISNNAGGYGFYESPGQNRIIRYRFNSVPADRPGRYVYFRDEKGDFWTGSWSPTQKDPARHKTRCRHGLGYTTLESRYRGIVSETTCFVPPDEPVEVWRVTVTNRSRRRRELDAFGYAEFCYPYFEGENALQAVLFVAETWCADGVVGYRTPVPGWEVRERFFACTADVESFDSDREAFFGMWRDESRPAAVEAGRCSGSTCSGGNPCGALQVKLALDPGESRTFAFVLGEGHADTDGVRLRDAATPEWIDRQLDKLAERWRGRLDHYQCKTPDDAMNSMVNVWGAYQSHVTFRWSRSASLIEAGLRDGLGYRDTLQDTLGVMHVAADEARGRIVDLLHGQASDGSALHQVKPWTLKTGRGETPDRVYSDDHLWIPLALAAYVRETGDAAFLDEPIDWLDRGRASVFAHARKALEFTRAHLGAHGLALSLAADWNDALQLDEGGQSVWTSMQFCRACRDLAELADLLDRGDEAAEFRTWADEMTGRINDIAWDGHWYLRGMMGDGEPIGSHRNDVAQIWLNPQSWSVLAGVAPRRRAIEAMDAVHERLASEFGLHLFAPPHTDLDRDVPGRVSYPPGMKENAAIFCHPNPWAMMGETVLRRGDRAFEYYKALLPSAMNDRADLRHIEPYVYGQFVTGRWNRNFGKAHNAWLTGTASWCHTAATQYILGVRASCGGLVIDPCVPGGWDGFEVTRIFRGATYRISVANPGGVCSGVKRIKVGRRETDGNVVPIAEPGKTVRVKAELEGE